MWRIKRALDPFDLMNPAKALPAARTEHGEGATESR